MRKYYIPNNKYYITDEGRLFNKETDEEFIPYINKYGYKGLRVNGKFTLLHRLVATIWIPNPENKPQVDHIDRNKLNNSVNNLRWVTQQENMNNLAKNLPDGKRRKDLSEKEYDKLLQDRWYDNLKADPKRYNKMLERVRNNAKKYMRKKYAKQHGFDTWEEYQENKAKNS